MARITVLMPVYNAAPFLREAIDSVLRQTYSDFKLMLLNDGSTDDSETIILSYTDPRIIYISNGKNMGLVNTLNKGIEKITTEFIVRMDADDISLPHRFEHLVKAMDEYREVGVLSSYLELFGDKQEAWKMPLEDNVIKAGLIFNSTVAHAPCIIRTSLLNANNITYSSAFPHMEDWDLWFRLRKLTSFRGIPQVLYRYRILEHNVTVVNYHTLMERRKNFYRRIFNDLNWNVTDKEIEIHAALGKNAWFSREISIRDIRTWINKLIGLNRKHKEFPVNEFEALLRSKRNSLFFLCADKGFFNAVRYWLVFGNVKGSHFRYLFSMLFRGKKQK
ncbi:MAG TPA: glycosyltransferase family 2 protein [Flavobacteriales bacterium]|nr:glycosyltransferase family 2 protein [Flavobacteriales bacterium]